MNKIEFQIKETLFNDKPYRESIILIDGRNLLDMIKEYELPFAQKEGNQDIAGGYMGMAPQVLFDEVSKEKDEATIFICKSCGEWYCWPMFISIEKENNKVIWKNFRQFHRGPDSPASYWDFSAFPVFVFDKRQYEEALERLK